MLNGLLSAGDAVVDRMTDLVSSKQLVNGLKLVLIFTDLLGAMDVERLRAMIADGAKEPPSLVGMAKLATTKDTRRGMSVALGLMNVFGAALNLQQKKN